MRKFKRKEAPDVGLLENAFELRRLPSSGRDVLEQTADVSFIRTYLLSGGILEKFTRLESRGRCEDALAWGQMGVEIGYALDRCSIPTDEWTKTTQGESITLIANSNVTINMWWLKFLGPPECDPIDFDYKLSTDGGVTWSESRATMDRYGWIAKSLVLPEERNAAVELDYSNRVVYSNIARSAAVAVGCLLAAVFGAFQKETFGRCALAMGFLMSSAATVSAIVLSKYYIDFRFFLMELPYLMCIAVSVTFQSIFVPLGTLSAAYYVALGVFQMVNNSIVLVHVSGTLAVALFWVSIHASRWHALRQSKLHVMRDRTLYDEAWNKIKGTWDIEQLGAIARTAANKCRKTKPQQRERLGAAASSAHDGRLGGVPINSLLDESNITNGLALGTPGMVSEGTFIRSLDQLYAAAAVVNPLLRQKAQEWAISSHGMVSCRGREGFILCEDALRDIDLMESVRWAKVKNPDRAIEKMLRVYKGDSSYLVDLSRQSLVFEQVSHLRDCLDFVLSDDAVVVERIKNRYDTSYDSSVTAGYRDVSLNVRIVTEETCRYMLDSHICELQLILKDYAELKTEQGHKRYVNFRNLRGE